MDKGVMRLDKALLLRGFVESRTEAQECIDKGNVFVNGEVVTKPHKIITETDKITVSSTRKYVSRGGEKLEGVLHDVYGDDLSVKSCLNGKKALDIGASTGGFTDCLLSYGVMSVDAVDVGTLQLHPSLKVHPFVKSFENTDIRTFFPKDVYDIIVADVSFISLNHILPFIISHSHSKIEVFLLVKPQFEVGKEFLKKGIVKDKEKELQILEDLVTLIKKEKHGEILTFPCVIKGGDGNQEYFIYIHF